MTLFSNLFFNGTAFLLWLLIAVRGKYAPHFAKRVGVVMCILFVLNMIFYAPRDRYAFQYLAWISVIVLHVIRIKSRQRRC